MLGGQETWGGSERMPCRGGAPCLRGTRTPHSPAELGHCLAGPRGAGWDPLTAQPLLLATGGLHFPTSPELPEARTCSGWWTQAEMARVTSRRKHLRGDAWLSSSPSLWCRPPEVTPPTQRHHRPGRNPAPPPPLSLSQATEVRRVSLLQRKLSDTF